MVTVKKIKSIFPDQIILCQIYFFSKFFFVVAVLTMSSSSSGASAASVGAFDDLIPQGETAELDLGSDAPAASGQAPAGTPIGTSGGGFLMLILICRI